MDRVCRRPGRRASGAPDPGGETGGVLASSGRRPSGALRPRRQAGRAGGVASGARPGRVNGPRVGRRRGSVGCWRPHAGRACAGCRRLCVSSSAVIVEQDSVVPGRSMMAGRRSASSPYHGRVEYDVSRGLCWNLECRVGTGVTGKVPCSRRVAFSSTAPAVYDSAPADRGFSCTIGRACPTVQGLATAVDVLWIMH
jgi:hypothetical protein